MPRVATFRVQYEITDAERLRERSLLEVTDEDSGPGLMSFVDDDDAAQSLIENALLRDVRRQLADAGVQLVMVARA